MTQLFRTFALLFLLIPSLKAQDISGSWQGALGTGKNQLRLVLEVSKADDGGWQAKMFSIDQQPDTIPVASITQQGTEVAFAIPELKLSYKGTLSADGNSIVGKLTQNQTRPLTLVRPTKETAWPHDIHCKCTVSFIPAEKDIKLEVLDWGGAGRPLILLAGLGDTAHAFDPFAQKLAAKYHVYGITRRGFGESSSPLPTEANYSADRLGDDVLAVIDALHLQQRPILAGHSIAGEELSSVGSRHPEKIAGLIYLDAAYEYAFYNPQGDVDLDALAVRKELGDFIEKNGTDGKAASDLLQQLPALEKELQARQQSLSHMHPDPPEEAPFGPSQAILLGQQKYTKIPCPILAIFAEPHKLDPMKGYTAAERAAETKFMEDHTATHSHAFEAGVPSAHVVRIPNADHYVFESNEADVLREMETFIAKLPN